VQGVVVGLISVGKAADPADDRAARIASASESEHGRIQPQQRKNGDVFLAGDRNPGRGIRREPVVVVEEKQPETTLRRDLRNIAARQHDALPHGIQGGARYSPQLRAALEKIDGVGRVPTRDAMFDPARNIRRPMLRDIAARLEAKGGPLGV